MAGTRKQGRGSHRIEVEATPRWEDSPVAGTNNDLYVTGERRGNLAINDSGSWYTGDCSFCRGSQMVVIAKTDDTRSTFDDPSVYWLRCVNCRRGFVLNDFVASPAAQPLDTPAVLSGDELTTWTEVRTCLAGGANTAAVMMCRKLLLHIAVANGLPPKDAKDRAPSFLAAIDHLEAEGVITTRMRPWVNRVKDVGNEANHELASIDGAAAKDVALFTRQLLHLAYELPAMVGSAEGSEKAAGPSTPSGIG